MQDQEEQLQEAIRKLHQCEQEIGKCIIGQKDVIRQVLLAILADGNVMLEGLPGLGKTELVKAFSKAMDLTFSRIQFTPDLMPADVTGTNLILREENRNVFQFESGPVFANLVLADEINRATPKTQSALLEAMQEKTVTVGKKTYTLPQPFVVLATQNPIEQEGTYPLPEAQLDRFLLKLLISFPSLEELKEIMAITTGSKRPEPQAIVSADDLIQMRQMIREIPVADAVLEYALNLVIGTHPREGKAIDAVKKYVQVGASPRAAQAILKTAKARAFLEGRYHVSLADIRSVAYPALRHRILLNFEAISDGIDADDIVTKIIDEVSL